MYMILFVLDNKDDLDPLLDAWESVGVKGVTVMPSTGLGRIRQNSALWDDIPIIPSIENLMRRTEDLNRTIFTIVESDEMVDKVIESAQAVVGDLCNPNTGILAVIPLARVYGLKKHT